MPLMSGDLKGDLMMDDSGWEWETELDYVNERVARSQAIEAKTRPFDVSLKKSEGPRAF